MPTDLKTKIAAKYYKLGYEAPMQTKTSSVKDIARTIGLKSAKTFPTIGTLGGIVGGGYLGANLGGDFAHEILEQALREGDNAGALSVALFGTPVLAGAGFGIGGTLGGIGGSQVGRGAKQALLDALRKKPKNNLYRI